jgi:hypothetical protein
MKNRYLSNNLAFIYLIVGTIICQVCDGQTFVTNALWTSPNRIPVLCVAPNGGLLAFVENRIIVTNYDGGYVNVTLRRSMDDGTNWTPMQTIASDGTNTFSCGAVVTDTNTGTMFFFAGWGLFGDGETAIDNKTSVGTRHMYLLSSTNSGTNWSAPVEITSSVKQTNWDWCDPGPATGIQLASGRLIVPWYYSIMTNYYPSVMYSDDDGTTWLSSVGATNNMAGYDECSVVALTNGNLMMITRNDTKITTFMGISISTNEGVAWSPITNSTVLSDSGCEASFIRYTAPPGYGKTRLIFANPDSPILYNRVLGTVRISYDEGQTWAVSKLYYPNMFGYSALAILPNHQWGLLSENGTSTYYDQISFMSDTLSNLTDGADELDPQTVRPPMLKFSIVSANLVLSWPTSSIPYSLQEAIGPVVTNWTSAAGVYSVSISNGQNQFSHPYTNHNEYFRLKSP